MAFPTTSVLDTFTRTGATLGADWTAGVYGSTSLSTNGSQAKGNGSLQWGENRWTAATFGASQEVFATIAQVPGAGYTMGLGVQITDAGGGHPEGWWVDNVQGTGLSLSEVTAGTWTQRGSTYTVTCGAGDTVGLEQIWSDPTNAIKVYYKASGGSWTQAVSYSGSNYHAAGTNIAIGMQAGSWENGAWDDFGGGTVSAGIAVALTGTGTASATLAGVKTQVAAALTGAGSLAASPGVRTQVAATLTGAGTLAANVEAGHSIAAALTGAGTLTATDVAVASPIAASLTGTGTLAANADLGAIPIAASLSGAGSLAADVTVGTTVAAALTGTGSLAADVSVVSAGSIAASLAGAGTLAVSEVTVASPIAAALTGTGTLAADVTASSAVAAALTGTGALAAEVSVGTSIVAALTGAGTLAANVSVVAAGSIAASLSGAGSLAADVTVGTTVAAALTGTGSLAAGVTVGTTVAAALSGAGSLSATLEVVPVPGIAAALVGQGTLAVSEVTVSVPISANLTGTGTLRATVEPDVVAPEVVVPQPRGSIVNVFEYLRERPYYLRATVEIELTARARLPEVVLEGARAGLALGAPSIRAARLPGALADLAVVWSRAGQPALVEVTAPDAEDWQMMRRQLAELRRERLEWRGAVAALRERDDDAEMLRWLLMA